MKNVSLACLLIVVWHIPSLFAQPKGSTTSTLIDIGSRRELFVDNFLIERILGKAQLRIHHPVAQEAAIVHDAPWEGNSSIYHSVFKDGDIYRMYYRGSQINYVGNKIDQTPHPFYFCYAESTDGIHWNKPELGLYEFNGSTRNNIVLSDKKHPGLDLRMGDNVSFFKDTNPNVAADERYKAIGYSKNLKGLVAFKSPNGIHWSPMSNGPVITDGAFDSQNLAFWDTERKHYVAYWRIFKERIRAIRTATSKDFIHWDERADLVYVDSPEEELYTNQIMAYYRAPHIFVGFPARYIDREWTASTDALPEREHREMRSKISMRYGSAFTEGLFMTSRDGVKFRRWNESFMPPGIERPGTWNYGQGYIAWGLVETKSRLEGAPAELSLYATEGSWTGTSDVLRRYTLRMDGFASLWAPMDGGGIITKPIRFSGKQMLLNFSTSAAGTIRVELQDAEGKPLPGYTLNDCSPVFGDALERTVVWKNGSDVSSLSGKTVRIRFELHDAHVYSFHYKN